MESITVTINGERRAIPPAQRVSDLLAWLQVGSDRVAVELDKMIVRKRDWSSIDVTDGANIEIVEFVGGG
jgi:thiamine biosynthesis protein ThiS